PTSTYHFASTREEFDQAIADIGMPCLVKPVMSSSGKGQSVVTCADDLPKAWEAAMAGARGTSTQVIVEEFLHFDLEITLLTIRQRNGETLFCA
ncbi:MAG: ATP-grasp domain-containing protein, partial [Synechococcus sp.]